MSSSRSFETKITDAISKINKGLGAYFGKTVGATCVKIKQVDESWFVAAVEEVTQEFLSKSDEGLQTLLKQYSVNQKGAQLDYANRHLKTFKAWYYVVRFIQNQCFRQPSGDPNKDIRAHLLAVDREHVDVLAKRVLDLNRELRPRVNEVSKQERLLRDEFTELRLMLKQVDDLLALVREVDKSCSFLRPTDIEIISR
ncbi:hypothetical protein EG68_03455 [Paragonimus skrjabini miyazakii]|uniref:Uncharacterized protein n=1 Tax=Paragonimus skrjabini miyazakii TaxID=59628 RepID=A0A8S9YW82_9TREM|nr:hypothetical protein EG68_03455 [Paragonimus skrjabini miyazakii]